MPEKSTIAVICAGSKYSKTISSILENLREYNSQVIFKEIYTEDFTVPHDFDIANPNFDMNMFAKTLRTSKYQIWVSPLYHGGIPGHFKSCLDYAEILKQDGYLQNSRIGLICYAGGSQAVHGLINMQSIAQALRATVLPLQLSYDQSSGNFDTAIVNKLDIFVNLLLGVESIPVETSNNLNADKNAVAIKERSIATSANGSKFVFHYDSDDDVEKSRAYYAERHMIVDEDMKKLVSAGLIHVFDSSAEQFVIHKWHDENALQLEKLMEFKLPYSKLEE